MATQRNPAIDVIKGSLMLLVMLGHLSGAGVEYSLFKWVLYGFHMPMFMALSGYMTNVEKLRASSLGAVVARYWWRMILPWLVVFVVALPYVANWRSPWGLAQAFLHPWNHLWFVPVLFAYIAVAVVAPVSRAWLLLAALPPGVAMWYAPQLFGLSYASLPFDVRYLYDAPFFFFGLWLRTSAVVRQARLGWWIVPVFLASLAVWSLTFRAPHSLFYAVYPLMTASAILIIPWAERLPLRGAVLEAIGVDSLFFYLHHPWLFNIARRTLYRWMDINLAYGATLVITIALLLGARRVLARWRWAALITGTVPAGG
jgi:acyltransferase